ncbi:MAG: hypothetical protein PHE96_02385 [Methylococcales bacterium]|nr:hypothetical protein [Methylococcales bacterium]
MNVLLYGLSWSLPFLTPCLQLTEKPAEITVVLGEFNEDSVSWSHVGVCYKASPGAYFLLVPGVARFLLTNGNTVIIDAQKHVLKEEILHFLFNPVAGALLMQRGILPLQASAVEKDGKAAILLGGSASGKSLIAAGLMQRGFKVITDNVCAVHSGENPMLKAGYPHLLLWKRALQELGYDPTGLCKFRQNIEKYRLPIAKDCYAIEAPIERLYLLAHSNENTYPETRITGRNKFTLLLDCVYHNPLIEAFGMQTEMYQIIISLAQRLPMKKVASPMSIQNARKFIDAFASRYQS